MHNFYLGYTRKAVIQLLITVLTLGILAFVWGIWGLFPGSVTTRKSWFTRYCRIVGDRPIYTVPLYCFARHDQLFTPEEFRALYQRSHARFETLGAGQNCELCEYDGPHGYNHRETCDTIHRWFDEHVAGEKHLDVDTLAVCSRLGGVDISEIRAQARR